jgi:hypothetical protein
MNCSEFGQHLQAHWDGDDLRDEAALQAHLAECSYCRGRQATAEQLDEALRLSRLPVPPVTLRNDIVARALLAYGRSVFRRRVAAAAVAAVLLIAAYYGLSGKWPGEGSSKQELAARTETAQPSSLRSNVEQAVGALTGLANQTAESALAPRRILFPDDIAVALLTQSATLQTAKLAVPSLQEAGPGVREFIPVAPLGRFFNYFTQEIPTLEQNRTSG